MTQSSISPGDRFGKLVVISPSTRNGKLWRCKCDCGGTISVYASHLLTKKKHSCCNRKQTNRKDYTDQKFGMLTALEFARLEPNGNSVWRFKCDCGNEIERIIRQVVQGAIKTCGCSRIDLLRRAATYPPAQAIQSAAYASHVKTASKRSISTSLSKEEYLSIAKKPCHYCGDFSMRTNPRTGETIQMNSVDRLNNEPFYNIDNAVPACFICQHMKSCYSESLFLEKVSKIVEYRGLSDGRKSNHK